MSVVSLKDKRPEHHKVSSLRRAIRSMNISLDKQKASVAKNRTNFQEFKFIMEDMKQNMLKFDENLGNINISKLGDESRKLSKIMAGFSA
jgi:hypothetical protein